MKNQSTNQPIKCLMITGSNEDPRRNDDWWSVEMLEAGKDYTREELIALAKCDIDDAIWLYEGEDWEDKNVIDAHLADGSVRYGDKFYPWDTDHVKLVRLASLPGEKEDNWKDEWRREQAMEAGMMGGLNAYNEVMGYDLGNHLAES